MTAVYIPHPFRVIEKPKGKYTLYNGTQKIAKYCNMMNALCRIDNMMKKEGLTSRDCMCCSNSFASEGIHNRLCKKCRQDTGGMV